MQTTVETEPRHSGRTVTVTRAYGARGFRLKPGESIDCGFSEFSREGRDPLIVTLQAGDQLPACTTAQDGKLYAAKLHEGVPYAVMLLEGTWE